jgi:hypothetical protein
MKIGVLTTSFPRREGDIAGAFVLGFARALAARGHAIEVLAPEPAERNDTDSPPTWDGVDVRWIPYVRPRAWSRTFYGAGAPENVATDPRAWLGVATWPIALTRAARDTARGWDAIVPLGAPWRHRRRRARRARPPRSDAPADLHLLSRLPTTPARRRPHAHAATAMLFVSTRHRDDFVSWFPSRAQVEATGSHVFRWASTPPTPAAARPPPPDARFAPSSASIASRSMGRLVPVKGLIDAIDACAGLPHVELLAGKALSATPWSAGRRAPSPRPLPRRDHGARKRD